MGPPLPCSKEHISRVGDYLNAAHAGQCQRPPQSPSSDQRAQYRLTSFRLEECELFAAACKDCAASFAGNYLRFLVKRIPLPDGSVRGRILGL